MLDPNDLAKTYYAAARAEIIERLELREQVLLAGVTAFGVIGGLVVSGKVPGLLSLFPVLSLAFTLVFFRHHFLITDLANYINGELGPSLGLPKVEPADAEKMPLHWDAWLLAPKGRYTGSAGRSLLLILRLELLVAWLLLWGPGAGAWLFLDLYSKQRAAFSWVNVALLLLTLAFYVVEAWRLRSRPK